MKGHIRPRGDKSWAIILDLGRDENGKRRQKWHTVHGTKRDAQREMTRLLNELNTGSYVEPSKLTVGEYLKKWLEDSAKVIVSPKTFETYEGFIRTQITPALGHHKLEKLAPLHIQGFYSQSLQSGRRDGKGGLSPQTVLHFHRILREALQQAVKWQLLARNPCDAVDAPTVRRKDMKALAEDGTVRLLDAAKATRLRVPILVAVTTGLRRGELLGLRWQDLDLEAGSLEVRQTIEQTKGSITFKGPKTAKSRRSLPLYPLAVEALVRHKGAQAEHRLLVGPAYQDNGLVFALDDGRPWSPGAFSHAFGDLLKRTGVPHLRFHDLRHSHASQLFKQNTHPKIVSERLGHSTIGITMDTYSHMLPGMQEEAVRQGDAELRKAMGED